MQQHFDRPLTPNIRGVVTFPIVKANLRLHSRGQDPKRGSQEVGQELF